MTHNNITLNLSKCTMSVAKAKLSNPLVWTPVFPLGKFHECRRKLESSIETQFHIFAILHANVYVW